MRLQSLLWQRGMSFIVRHPKYWFSTFQEYPNLLKGLRSLQLYIKVFVYEIYNKLLKLILKRHPSHGVYMDSITFPLYRTLRLPNRGFHSMFRGQFCYSWRKIQFSWVGITVKTTKTIHLESWRHVFCCRMKFSRLERLGYCVKVVLVFVSFLFDWNWLCIV